jgi:anthranilate phosphoribosyltransferase
MSNPLRDILLKLCAREDLTRDEAREAFTYLMSGHASDTQIGGLLVGLAAKGTTVDELVGAAMVMREKAVAIACDPTTGVVLDTCGTGGDVRGTFNISTAAAIIAAAAGVKVVKHGNRSASGKSGSADVLEKLGLQLELPQPRMRLCLNEANICFAFARSHHPAMKHVAAARSSLGIPTIFNLLGPLTNPARARHQLLGVFAPELTDRLAAVLQALGSERAWVVHADDGLDEISTLGPTRISELKEGRVTTWRLDPASLGLPCARLSDLVVENTSAAADALLGVLRGERGPRRDIALLNAAAALVVAGASPDLPHALSVAAEAIDDGSADRTLQTLIRCSQTEAASPFIDPSSGTGMARS